MAIPCPHCGVSLNAIGERHDCVPPDPRQPKFAKGDNVYHYEGRWLRDCEIVDVGEYHDGPTYTVRGAAGPWSKHCSYPALEQHLFPVTGEGRAEAIKFLQDTIGNLNYEINRLIKSEAKEVA